MQLQFKIGPAKITIEAERPPKAWSRDYRRLYYRPFEVSDSSVPDLTIRIHHDALPSGQATSLIAEIPSHWRLFSCEVGYRLEFLDQIRLHPKTVFLMNEAMNWVEAYVMHPLDWLVPAFMESLAWWWLANWLACRKSGFVLHGTAFSLGEQTFVFFGPSGAGKTTIARLCQSEGSVCVLSDERIVVWHERERWQVSGTPWPGELHVASSETAQVTRLAMLSKGEINQWIFVPQEKLLPLLISETFLPVWNKNGMGSLVEAARQFLDDVPAGELVFKNDPGVVSYLKSLAFTHGMGKNLKAVYA